MYSGYTLKRDDAVDNLLQQTLKASTSRPHIPNRPNRWLETLLDKSDTDTYQEHEILAIDFEFYNGDDANAVKKMAKLYGAWKSTIAHLNIDDSGRELHELVNLGVPRAEGIIAGIVVDNWDLEKAYPYRVSYDISEDSRRGTLTVVLYTKIVELIS